MDANPITNQADITALLSHCYQHFFNDNIICLESINYLPFFDLSILPIIPTRTNALVEAVKAVRIP